MNFITLKYFIAVAEERNFTKAANKNHISQTAISQQIAKLEDELEVKLFERASLPVTLTPAGERVYRRALIIQGQYLMMKDDIQEIKLNHYVYRVAYPSNFYKPLEETVFPKFNKIPNLEFVFKHVNHDDIQNLLLHKMIDFALCFNEDINNYDEIKMLTVAEGDYQIIKPINSIGENILRPDNLNNQILIYVKEGHNSAHFNAIKKLAQKDNLKFNDVIFVSDLEEALLLTRMNKGWAIIPDFYRLNLEALNLESIPLKSKFIKYKIVLGYRPANTHVKQLIASLK